MSVTALIVAAGSGSRMGGEVPKQFRLIAGKSVLAHAVDALASHSAIDEVRVVVGEGQQDLARQALGNRNVGELITGGATRFASAYAGLREIGSDIVLIHDAARPFCPHDVIDRLLDAMQHFEGATPVLPSRDTLTQIGPDKTLGQRVDRDEILRVQTPQAFQRQTLWHAIEDWRSTEPTDETAFLLARQIEVAAVDGSEMLEKLTSPADFERAEALHSARLVSRTGLGFDVHAFAGEGPIVMGGIRIPHDRGLAGHSDADVVLHSITDALLGAAGLGDIGQHFPPSDPQWKGADSSIFLAHAAELVRGAGGVIDFVDCTIICEAPKVGPHRGAMRARVAEIIGIPAGAVSIKATTTERLGFTGRREGIAAQAVANVRMPTAAQPPREEG